MKTMTCRDMGGVCDTEFTTETPKEMMKIAGDHVMAATDPEQRNGRRMGKRFSYEMGGQAGKLRNKKHPKGCFL